MGRWLGTLGKLPRGDNKWTLTQEMSRRHRGKKEKKVVTRAGVRHRHCLEGYV